MTGNLSLAEAVNEMQSVAPRVYYANHATFMADWIAEGTDGNLYTVPAEPGGWLRRTPYEGQSHALTPVCAQKASTIVWFVYGDVGRVRIADGEGEANP